ncbi:serine hydrolase [Streptomyces sp. NPDC048664]|uniref:serine hydrolase n=1 Tax=Streptomyces sp. NPDC048664 TaxID=3154505 RepID=UPI003421FD7B
MHSRLPTLSRPTTAARGRARRALACAAVLATSVTALFTAGALHPTPARAATPAPAPATAAPAQVTAAVLDLDGAGRRPAVFGDDTPYDTASIIKVDILASVLLQAQDAGRDLTAEEQALAEKMIEHSDNASATTLWQRIGEAPGLEAANQRLGLTSTEGGAGRLWGLTRTTASDQIRLLLAVFDDGASKGGSTALNESSRGRLKTLMSRIATEQSWGVSAAGDSGWALKNGWLQRSATQLWDINSIGEVTAHGHRYLVAVLSNGNASMRDGISLVERTARSAVASA